MYSIYQFLLLFAQLYSITCYLYSNHDYANLMQDYYSDAAHRSTQSNFQSNLPSAPQFINQPPSQVIFFNETGIVLPCSVYAQPKAIIKWLQPNTFDVNSYLTYNNGKF